MSSVSDESESEEHDASWSESEPPPPPSPSCEGPLRLRAFAPGAFLRAPARRALVEQGPLAPVGHALCGGGAVRLTRDCLLLTAGECSDCLGELERALSEEPDAASAASVFQESRTTGGPSSAEKSVSGRSCRGQSAYAGRSTGETDDGQDTRLTRLRSASIFSMRSSRPTTYLRAYEHGDGE